MQAAAPLAISLTQRVLKNARHFKKWARCEDLTAYRIYDRDIPEFPYAIDWYDGRLHWAAYPRRRARNAEAPLSSDSPEVSSVAEALEVPIDQVYLKLHAPKAWGKEQYQRLGRTGREQVVREQGLRFSVNLSDYLDTGLFLDHRVTRARVRAEVGGKRFLNLFAYTGAFTVYAAAGGAHETTTVDLSPHYLEWGERNLALNGLQGAQHHFERADALRWLRETDRSLRYDLIVLDPPSFSTSKAMERRFEIQRDHPRLVADALGRLAPGGTLYFSTNFQGFEAGWRALPPSTALEELTPRSIPPDIRPATAHRCWRFVISPAA